MATIYDKPLADAVKKFQQEHELKVSGTARRSRPSTRSMAVHPTGRSSPILANLERWRWMPHDLGKDYVIVNLPDYMLRVLPRRPAGLDDQDRHRQADNGDADHDARR